MRKLFTFLLLITAITNVSAQDGAFCQKSTCYQQGTCYADAFIDSVTYTFATVHNIFYHDSVSVDLKMTVYSPCKLPDPITSTVTSPRCPNNCKRPFILLMHGGGFRVGCKKDLDDECREFARRGYVAATIDYRLGWVPADTSLTCNNNFCVTDSSATACHGKKDGDSCKSVLKDSMDFALYRALQDAHAAMRFIRHYAANINVDPNYLYIGGQSAGSIAAVNITYMNQNELDLAMPKAKPVLGKYDTSGNVFRDTFHIAGLYNNWGAVLDTSYIKAIGNRVPMIAFHGIDDPVVPFGNGPFLNCDSYRIVDGSDMIYQRLTQKYPGMPVELYACKGGHGIFEGNPTKDSLSLYRIQKAVCFFRRVRQGETDTNYLKLTLDESQITRHFMDSISPVDCDISSNITSVANNSNTASHDSPNSCKIYIAKGGIICTYAVKNSTQIKIVVYDISGRVMESYNALETDGIKQHKFDKILSNGVYVVSISYNNNMVCHQKISILK